MSPSRYLLVAAALAVCLIAGSPQRIVGDGGEYLAQAINFSHFSGPSLRPREIPGIQDRIAAFDPALAAWQIDAATVAGRDRRRDFLHFWFYALLATPLLWITTAVGAAPTLAFAALNLILLGIALRVALPRIGPPACLLLFAGPIVWWIDKAHTESFTFALLVLAFSLMRDRPWWAMIAAGAAATQNPPIAVVSALVFAWGVARGPAMWRDRRFQIGTVAGACLALLHPAYTYWRYHTPSLLLYARRPGVPTLPEIAATVVDPTIGLVGNFPIFLLVVAVGFVAIARRDWRRLVSMDAAVVAISGVTFLVVCAQTTNVHHGGTPSLSRYALWLIPLAVPLFAWLHERGSAGWRRFLVASAVVSALVSVVAFHPRVPQNSREPTWLATYLWTRHPAWDNPLPEVFIETELHAEQSLAPVTTDGCAKILIAGRGPGEGIWPVPCYPSPIPDRCLQPGIVCYANRHGSRYDFVRAPGRASPPAPARGAAWPSAAEPIVRQIYAEWDWPALSFNPDDVGMLRQSHGVDVSVLGNADRCILTLRNAGPDAFLILRPPTTMTGSFIDADTGRSVQTLHLDGPAKDAQMLPVPQGYDVLLLALRPDQRP